MTRIIKWAVVTGLFAAVALALLLWLEAGSHPRFSHPFMQTTDLGHHYFVNDVAGISPPAPAGPRAFVISHSSRAAALLTRDGANVLAPADDYGLPQSPNVRGWGATDGSLQSGNPIAIQYFRTVLSGSVTDGDDLPDDAGIRIGFPWRAIARSFGDVRITGGWDGARSDFLVRIDGPGTFWIETRPPPSDGFPIEFSLVNIEPAKVTLGAEQRPAPATNFGLTTRDLHSFAVGELDGDAGMEFSVVRGGIRGRVGEVLPDATDFLVDTDGFNDVTRRYPEFRKRGCPGRQSAWVDIDNDNDLDLYVVCGRPSGDNAESPNRLFVFDNGTFHERAADFDIDFAAHGAFRFVDLDDDGDQDLLWAAADGTLLLAENRGQRFVESDRIDDAWSGGSRQPQLLIHDIDADAVIDILLFHPLKSVLIEASGGSITMTRPGRLGLPQRGYAATWSDIDLDGFADLVTATQGIYFGGGDGRFVRKRDDEIDAFFVSDARLVSFATDRGREFLFAYRRCLPWKLCGARRELLSRARRYIPLPVRRLESLGLFEPYDWFLQSARIAPAGAGRPAASLAPVAIQLNGPAFNPRSLGATIEFEQAGRIERHWVGESESAVYSQGDSLMYVGMDRAGSAAVRAAWPDGCEARVAISPVDSSATPDSASRGVTIVIARPPECGDGLPAPQGVYTAPGRQ